MEGKNFRDGVIQSSPIDGFYKYNKFKTSKEAAKHIKNFRTKEIAAIEMKIQKLRKKQEWLVKTKPVLTDIVGTYEQIEKAGKSW
jgi:hypothetical protein